MTWNQKKEKERINRKLCKRKGSEGRGVTSQKLSMYKIARMEQIWRHAFFHLETEIKKKN